MVIVHLRPADNNTVGFMDDYTILTRKKLPSSIQILVQQNKLIGWSYPLILPTLHQVRTVCKILTSGYVNLHSF